VGPLSPRKHASASLSDQVALHPSDPVSSRILARESSSFGT
jgi:hypothetical protein